MRILRRYLTSGFLVTCGMALLVITFVMCVGLLIKVTDLIARGVSWAPVLRILLFGLPQTLTYSIPISVLVGCLLVFGRLSADGEITAMKASGVSLWDVIRTPCVIAAWLSLLCAFLNNEVEIGRAHV